MITLKTAFHRLCYASCIAVLATISSGSSVFANAYLTPESYIENGIYIYGSAEGCVSVQLSGDDNQEMAFGFLVSKGLTPQQAAGVVGNMVAESGVLPMRLQGKPAEELVSSVKVESMGNIGWGIVQWTPGSKMIKPSISAGKSYDEIDTLAYQLQFLWEQLEGTGTGATIGEKAAGDHLKLQTTIDGSARSFMLKYERPADQSEAHQRARVKLANDVFGRYGDSQYAGISSGGCSGEGAGDIVSIAKAELAKNIKEQPIGCDAGNPSIKGSCGKEIDKYTDTTLEYWCADFVSWVYAQAGSPFSGGASGGWRIPGVDSVREWFKKNATYTVNGPGVTPKPGDVYIIGTEGNGTHTGIVEKVENGKIYTISGNTSVGNFSNGVGVGASEYPVGSTVIHGFGSLSK